MCIHFEDVMYFFQAFNYVTYSSSTLQRSAWKKFPTFYILLPFMGKQRVFHLYFRVYKSHIKVTTEMGPNYPCSIGFGIKIPLRPPIWIKMSTVFFFGSSLTLKLTVPENKIIEYLFFTWRKMIGPKLSPSHFVF